MKQVGIMTFKIPRFELVEINLSNNVKIDGFIRHLLPQIVIEKLLIGGMKSESGWN